MRISKTALGAGAVGAVLGAGAAVIARNAAKLKPTPIPDPLPASNERGTDKSVERFREMLKLPTVWGRENPNADHTPFDSFVPRMRELYPRTFSQLELTMIDTYGILLKWEGSDPTASPVVFMAHHDVVEANPEGWSHDPFAADVADGRIWARGTVDTKCILAGLYEAAETLLERGFTPARTVYLWSSNTEEDNGPTTPALIAYFEEHGIVPGLVLDEGGAIIDNPPLGIDRDFAVIGVAEKGLANAYITVDSAGGHASTPSPDDSTARLVSGLDNLLSNPPKPKTNAPLEAMLRELASYGSFGIRAVLGNLWLFRPLVRKVLTADHETASMVRSTYALTELAGSPAANVLPKQAKATLNIRIDPHESVHEVIERVRDAIPGAIVDVVDPNEPSRISPFEDDPGFDYLRRVIHSVYPDAGIAPYVQSSLSDARHMSRVFPRTYRFAGFLLRGDQRSRIHGQDENIDVESFKRGVGFYIELIANLDKLEV